MKIHEKPQTRRTYAPHSVYGWYLVPEVNYYRFYNRLNIDTGGETTQYTIAFFPAFMKTTNFNSRNMAIHAAADLAKALKTPRP